MKNYLAALLLIAVFVSCSRVKPEPPAASTLDTLIQPPVSVLYVPVQYRVSAFESLVNEKIEGTFVNKWLLLNTKGDSLHLQVTKIRNITLRRDVRTLNLVVPLRIAVIARVKAAGIKIKNDAPVVAEVNIHLSSTLHLDTGWNMIADCKLKKIEWIKEPTLKVGFVNVPLKPAVEKVIADKGDALVPLANKAITQALNTRKVASDIWRDIQDSHVINRIGKTVWLKAIGVDLSGRLQETDPDLISLLFELKTYTHIYFEGDSIPPINAVLPKFKRIEQDRDSLTIYVHSLIRFDVINDLMEKELDGKVLSAKGFSTTIKKVRVYGTPTGLAVQLKVKGDIDGTLYVKGNLSYDSLTTSIQLKDFDFDLQSENSLLNSADWLLHSQVLDLVKDKLKVNLAPLAAKLPSIIMKAIEKGKTGEKIDFLVDTLALHPLVILPTRDNLQLLVLAQGNASVVLNEKLFNKNEKKVSVR